MAELPDHIRLTIEEYRTKAIQSLGNAHKAIARINGFEADFGLPPTTIEDLLKETTAESSVAAPMGTIDFGTGPTNAMKAPPFSGHHKTIRPDQFLGMQPLEAAKSYLTLVGYAQSIEEISGAVKSGGAAIKGADWKEKLEASLTRSVADVIKVQDHTFGLVRFYSEEQIKGIRATRRQQGVPTKKGRRHPRKKLEGEKPPRLEPTPEQVSRIKELAAQGKALADISREVKLHHLAVYRILGGKPKKANAAA